MELCTKPIGNISEEPKKELQNFSKGVKKDIIKETPLDLSSLISWQCLLVFVPCLKTIFIPLSIGLHAGRRLLVRHAGKPQHIFNSRAALKQGP